MHIHTHGGPVEINENSKVNNGDENCFQCEYVCACERERVRKHATMKRMMVISVGSGWKTPGSTRMNNNVANVIYMCNERRHKHTHTHMKLSLLYMLFTEQKIILLIYYHNNFHWEIFSICNYKYLNIYFVTCYSSV